MSRTKLSTNLMQTRRAFGVTQAEAAGSIGISKSALASYEEGRAEPCLEIYFKICQYYRVEDPALFCGLGEYKLPPVQPNHYMRQKVSVLAKKILEETEVN